MSGTWSQHSMVQVSIAASFRDCSPGKGHSENNKYGVMFQSAVSLQKPSLHCGLWVLLAPTITDCSLMISCLEIKDSHYR